MPKNSQSHALITGGTSGLGLAMAKKLARENYFVTILGRNRERLEKAVSELKNIHENIDGIAADISEPNDLNSAVEEFKKNSSQLDFLIINAGVVHVGALDDIDEADLKQDIDIDLYGTILSTKYFLPYLKEGSKVLLVSSALGLMGMAGYPSYCAAKAGIINFGAVLRRELLHKKISVYVACPADIETPQFEHEFASMPAWMKTKDTETKRPPLMSAEQAAQKILEKCRGNRFLILINFDISLLVLLSKILPMSVVNYILDRMFPRPE